MTGITIDLDVLDRMVFERIELDAQGAAIRAVLGDGANSIIHAEDLPDDKDPYVQGGSTQIILPKRPLLAFRAMPIFTTDRDIQIPTFRWHVYDDRTAWGYLKIKSIITLLGRAYAADPQLQFASGGVIGSAGVTDASSETSDPSLNLLLRYVTVTIVAR